MSEPQATQHSFSRGRRWLLRLNFLLAVVAMIAILVMLNYLAGGYFKRFNVASNSMVQLAPMTTRILTSLTNDISITIFFNVEKELELYTLTSSLLNEYQTVNPDHIAVKTLDYTRYESQARALLAAHNLPGLTERNFVLFECNGQSKILYAKALADYNINDFLSGKTDKIRRSSFRGEMLFTSAIFAVTNPRTLKAYFLKGHGEHSLEQTALLDSYSKFSNILTDELNAEVHTLTLLGTNTVPDDCQLMVIAGPYNFQFHSSELEKIDTYLKKGGRLLLLMNSGFNSGIEQVLSKWGVDTANEQVREQDKDYILKDSEGINFVAAKMQPHRILNAILAEKPPGAIQMFSPRPFSINATNTAPGAPEISILAASSDKSVCGKLRGSFPLIVTIEQGVIKSSSASSGGTRIVAIGDSYLFCDKVIDTGLANHAFAAMTLNWLLERPEMLLDGLVPRPISEYRLMLTNSQMTTLEFLLLFGLPGGVLVIGGLIWLRRRR